MRQSTFRGQHPRIFACWTLIICALLSACGGTSTAAPPVTIESAPNPAAISQAVTPAVSELPIPQIRYGASLISGGTISAVSKSPDEGLLGNVHGGALFWYDAKSLEEKGSVVLDGIRNPDPVLFSPDNHYACINAQELVFLVDLTTRSVLTSIEKEGVYSGFRFSPDSRYLVFQRNSTNAEERFDTLWILDTTTGRIPSELEGLINGRIVDEEGELFPTLNSEAQHTMTAPVVSPDSNMVAAGHSDGRVYVWNLKTAKSIYILEGHTEAVTDVAISSDGLELASTSLDGTVRIWSMKSGKLIRVITGFQSSTLSVQYREVENRWSVGVLNGQTLAIDPVSGEIEEEIIPEDEDHPVQDLTKRLIQDGSIIGDQTESDPQVIYSPDGSSLAAAKRSISIFDTNSYQLITSIIPPRNGTITNLAYALDGSLLAAANTNGDVWVWYVSTGKLLLDLKGTNLSDDQDRFSLETGIDLVSNSRSLAFSPDGEQLALGCGALLQVWDLKEKSKILDLSPITPSENIVSISFSEDGQRLYTVTNGGSQEIEWDAVSGEQISQVSLGMSDGTDTISTGLIGTHFARIWFKGGWAKLNTWDLETGKSTQVDADYAIYQYMTLTRDGKLAAAYSEDGLFFWNIDNGKTFTYLDPQMQISTFSLSPDGQSLAVLFDGDLTIWNLDGISQWLSVQNESTNGQIISEEASTTEIIPQQAESTPISTQTGVLSPDNAGQIQELSSFGNGTVERIGWSIDWASIITAGSLGLHQYPVQITSEIPTNGLFYPMEGWTFSYAQTDSGILTAGLNEAGDRVQVKNIDSGEILVDLDGGGQPTLSADGHYLAYEIRRIDDDGKSLAIYDMDRRQVRMILRDENDLQWPVFNPDGSLVAAVQTGSNSVVIWSISDGDIAYALDGPDADITDLNFSQDGQIMTAAAGGTAWIWDLKNYEKGPFQIEKFSRVDEDLPPDDSYYGDKVTAVAISSDHRLIAVGTSEYKIEIFSEEGQFIKALNGVGSAPKRLAFNQTGDRLLCAGENGYLTSWDVKSSENLALQNNRPGSVDGLTFSTDGNLVAWTGGSAWVIGMDDGQLIETTNTDTGHIFAASPSREGFAIYSNTQMSILNQDMENNLDGELTQLDLLAMDDEGTARQVYGAIYNLEGTRLITYGAGGVWYYNTTTGEEILHIEETLVEKAAIDSDGNWAIFAEDEEGSPPTIFNLQTGEIFTELMVGDQLVGPGNQFSQYAISGNGDWVAGLREDVSVTPALILWRVEGGSYAGMVPFEKSKNLLSLALSPDGRLAAIGTEESGIILVNLDTMRIATTLEGHRGAVTHLAFNADGSLLASAGEDGTVRVWGVEE